MTTLRIEHPVPDYDAWKRAFDRDPAGRENSGVRRYQISRAVDDPNVVMIDLELDSPQDAEALLATLRGVWNTVEGTLIHEPKTRMLEAVEVKRY